MHVVTDDEPPIAENLPAAHLIQSDSAPFPIVSRYVPGGHCMHVVTDDEPLLT